MREVERCHSCRSPLSGRQRKFCSRRCKNADTNTRLQSYEAQQARGAARKLQLVQEAGGRCLRCGYAKNLAALTWHHRHPADKSFDLDLRALSNRSMTAVRAEIGKCELLCANCHAEEHNPGFNL
jgi:hypothetical protein